MRAEFRLPFSGTRNRQDVIEEGKKSARNTGCCISESIYPRFPGGPPVSGGYFCSPTFSRESRGGSAGSLKISGFSATLTVDYIEGRFRSFNIHSPEIQRYSSPLEDEIVLKYPFNISSRIIYLFFHS